MAKPPDVVVQSSGLRTPLQTALTTPPGFTPPDPVKFMSSLVLHRVSAVSVFLTSLPKSPDAGTVTDHVFAVAVVVAGERALKAPLSSLPPVVSTSLLPFGPPLSSPESASLKPKPTAVSSGLVLAVIVRLISSGTADPLVG